MSAPSVKASVMAKSQQAEGASTKRAAPETPTPASAEPLKKKSKKEKKRESMTQTSSTQETISMQSTISAMQLDISPETDNSDWEAFFSKLERTNCTERRRVLSKIMQDLADVISMFDFVVAKLNRVHHQLSTEYTLEEISILDDFHRGLVAMMKQKLEMIYEN